MSRIELIAVLMVFGCAGEPTCPDPDAPVGAKLQCHMIEFLEDEGLMPNAVTDAGVLIGVSGRMLLDSRPGWTSTDSATYELGNPQLFMSGQRAIFREDASVKLFTFAATDRAAFLNSIELDATGNVINNGTARLPR